MAQGGWDEHYRYDGLGQLVELTRGDLNLNRTAIAATPKWEEQFAYDATGNWPGYRTLVNGAQSLDQSRTHNPANEIAAISNAPDTVTYDGVGNMTTMPKVGDWATAQTLTWDAWNRLMRVEEGSTVIGQYAYDGLVRRIWKVTTEDSLAIKRHYYYSDQWQVLEERVGSSTDAERQFLWGLRYIDDLVLRDRFADSNDRLYALHDQWHVTAITDIDGDAMEHYAYEAFGQSLVQAPDYTERAESSFGWEVLFGAYRFDPETGMYQVRFRYLQPELGRWTATDPASNSRFIQVLAVLPEWPILINEGDIALYSYLRNCPTISADPLGLERKYPGCRKVQVEQIEAALKEFCDKLQAPQSREMTCCVRGMNLADPFRAVLTKLKETCQSPNRTFRCAQSDDHSCDDSKVGTVTIVKGGYTELGSNLTTLCPSAFNKNKYPNLGCVIIHELTHSSGAGETLAYKVQRCFEGCPAGSPTAPG